MEYDRISRGIHKSLEREKDNGKYGEYLQIEKICCFRNKQLEAQFLTTLNKFIEKELSEPRPLNYWNHHQAAILRKFENFTVQISGHQDINLVPVWSGAPEETYFKIGESGHLSPKELEARGITKKGSGDAGYFGSGIYFTQFPSYAAQYAKCGPDSMVLLLSFVLMGRVYPVTETILNRADNLEGKPLKQGFDSHYILTKRHGTQPIMIVALLTSLGMFADVCAINETPDGDELLVRHSTQCLPRYLVYFKRVPRPEKGTEEAPLALRNAKNIILWLDPFAKVCVSPHPPVKHQTNPVREPTISVGCIITSNHRIYP